ncbi:MAG: hypothetical protein PHT48_02925 [Dechloromonas sp.]|nr:hypothetical protein [Dechloromonas sp.]
MLGLDRLFIRSLNHVLRQSPWACERLRAHAGAVVALQGGAMHIHYQIQNDGLTALADPSSQPTVTVSLPNDFPAKALVDRERLFATARLQGAVDVAETLAFVFRNLSWDAEGDVARLIGDIPARRFRLLAQGLNRALLRGGRSLAENITEYSVEEAALLPSAHEVSEFSAAVNGLRDDLARLEKRFGRL